MFLNLKNKNILVVGAGNVGARKIEKLFAFEPNITVVALKASDEVLNWASNPQNKITLHQRAYSQEDLQNQDIVIIATDDIEMQKAAYEYCIARRIPVNCVDSPLYCSFIFPALVLRGDATIGISTGGRAPGLSRKLRETIDELLPAQLDQILEEISKFRSEQKQSFKNFSDRATSVGALAKSLLEKHFSKKTNSD